MLTVEPASSGTPGRPFPRRPELPAELVVLSHLRWPFVWQRPQHVISRLGKRRRTWFVEEPLAVEGLAAPRLRTHRDGNVQRVVLEVPGPARHVCFADPAAACYPNLLLELVGDGVDRAAWLYTPMGLHLAAHLAPSVMVYDVMDDLASFAKPSAEVSTRHREALRSVDVVFTGGRSLHRAVAAIRPENTHCFPSGVDAAHYAAAQRVRRRGDRPVAGYVGVIDERLDMELIATMAAELPDWDIRMVGPVAKIDPAALPAGPNLAYPGQVSYADLPAVMAGFDVALMPFALNDATRSISPTKTLEYLAAGVPVVSTRVPDVVSDFRDLVDLQDDGRGFAAACRGLRGDAGAVRAAKVRPLLTWYCWDTIAERMEEAIADVVRDVRMNPEDVGRSRPG